MAYTQNDDETLPMDYPAKPIDTVKQIAALLDSTKWGFMTPEILKPTEVYEVENENGETAYLPGSLLTLNFPDDFTDLPEYLRRVAPFIDGEPAVITRRKGYMCRMSASGYMDSTDWEFCGQALEVLDWLEQQAEEAG